MLVLPVHFVRLHFFIPKVSRARNYVFTYFAPDGWVPSRFSFPHDRIKYLAGQFEIAPDTGRRHFQGYVVFHHAIGVRTAQRILDAPAAHFERRRGTHSEALAYVSKQESRDPTCAPVELGEPPAETQGSRSDLAAVHQAMADGATMRDLFMGHFDVVCKYSTGIMRAYSYLADCPRNAPPECYYLWGSTGTGKTRAAYDFATQRAEEIYQAPLSESQSVWFDRYDYRQHGVVVLDDYYHNYKLGFLLKLLDRYPMQVPVKGAYVNFNPRVVFITSNIPLCEQYASCPPEAVKALWRRFKFVLRCDEQVWVKCSYDSPYGLDVGSPNLVRTVLLPQIKYKNKI